jgi:hypothetical protein
MPARRIGLSRVSIRGSAGGPIYRNRELGDALVEFLTMKLKTIKRMAARLVKRSGCQTVAEPGRLFEDATPSSSG